MEVVSNGYIHGVVVKFTSVVQEDSSVVISSSNEANVPVPPTLNVTAWVPLISSSWAGPLEKAMVRLDAPLWLVSRVSSRIVGPTGLVAGRKEHMSSATSHTAALLRPMPLPHLR